MSVPEVWLLESQHRRCLQSHVTPMLLQKISSECLLVLHVSKDHHQIQPPPRPRPPKLSYLSWWTFRISSWLTSGAGAVLIENRGGVAEEEGGGEGNVPVGDLCGKGSGQIFLFGAEIPTKLLNLSGGEEIFLSASLDDGLLSSSESLFCDKRDVAGLCNTRKVGAAPEITSTVTQPELLNVDKKWIVAAQIVRSPLSNS